MPVFSFRGPTGESLQLTFQQQVPTRRTLPFSAGCFRKGPCLGEHDRVDLKIVSRRDGLAD